MGTEKFQRPGAFRHGLQVGPTGGSTFTSDAVFSSTVAAGVGVAQAVQSISLSGASGIGTTAVTNRGVTAITSTGTGAGWILPLAAPGKKGVEKKIVWNLSGASTVPLQLRTASSLATFFGTTKNAISWSTEDSTSPNAVDLVAITSAQWAVTNMSTNVTLIVGATA